MAVMGNVDGLKVRDRERGGKRGDGEGSHLATASGPEVLPSDGDGGSLGQQPCCRDGKAFPLGVRCKLPRGPVDPTPAQLPWSSTSTTLEAPACRSLHPHSLPASVLRSGESLCLG